MNSVKEIEKITAPSEGGLPFVIIDAPNVIFHLSTVSVERLRRIVSLLEELGIASVAIVDANTKYPVMAHSRANGTRDFDLLNELIAKQLVLEAPAGTFADWWMLQFASLHPNVKILTNDTFAEWKKEFPAIFEQDRFIRFMEINGELIMDLDGCSSKKKRSEV
jgi:hypothetical protein